MAQTPVDVIGVGSPIMDFIVEVAEEELAALDGAKGGMLLVETSTFSSLLRQLANEPVVTPGGSAANTAFSLARLGLRCAFLGKLGPDEYGTRYHTAFLQAGGDGSRFKFDKATATACCLSMVTPDCERTMRTDLGAALHLCPEDITPADFLGCRHAHVEGYLLFNPDLLFAVVRAAREAGCRISLDLGSFEVVSAARDILPDLLADSIDIVFANEEEAMAFCGHDDPQVGLQALGALCDTAVVKIGALGAWMQNTTERCHVPAQSVPAVKDTTGAGDLWAAGFLYGYLRGFPLEACGHAGALMSSHVIQYSGTALPHAVWDDVRAAVQTLTPNQQGAIHA